MTHYGHWLTILGVVRLETSKWPQYGHICPKHTVFDTVSSTLTEVLNETQRRSRRHIVRLTTRDPASNRARTRPKKPKRHIVFLDVVQSPKMTLSRPPLPASAITARWPRFVSTKCRHIDHSDTMFNDAWHLTDNVHET